MSETSDLRFLELFPAWLQALGDDVTQLGVCLSGELPLELRRYVIAGVNYLFKSLDLIPDGIDDIGYLDDAFVLRIAAAIGLSEARSDAPTLLRLAAEAKDVEAFLGKDYARLEQYVRGLRKGTARGRSVDDILTDDVARSAFLHEVASWGKDFETPSFTRDVKTIIKLRAFLNAKLP